MLLFTCAGLKQHYELCLIFLLTPPDEASSLKLKEKLGHENIFCLVFAEPEYSHCYCIQSHQDPACSSHASSYSSALMFLACLASVACVSECCLSTFALNCLC